MLALSLFRGHGLLVFCLPTYRKPRKRPRLLACPPLSRDLLDDAGKLLRDGHVTAAAMTARVEIERLLTTLAMQCPAFGPYWRGATATATWLGEKHVLRLRVMRSVVKANEVGNDAAHGHAVTALAVNEMLEAIRTLRFSVARKAGAV